jgi:hypothetical protein
MKGGKTSRERERDYILRMLGANGGELSLHM